MEYLNSLINYSLINNLYLPTLFISGPSTLHAFIVYSCNNIRVRDIINHVAKY